jgi:hypothetical protein
VNDQNFFAQPNVIMLKLGAMAAPRIGWIDQMRVQSSRFI